MLAQPLEGLGWVWGPEPPYQTDSSHGGGERNFAACPPHSNWYRGLVRVKQMKLRSDITISGYAWLCICNMYMHMCFLLLQGMEMGKNPEKIQQGETDSIFSQISSPFISSLPPRQLLTFFSDVPDSFWSSA